LLAVLLTLDALFAVSPKNYVDNYVERKKAPRDLG
jgi:hypothetical protein